MRPAADQRADDDTPLPDSDEALQSAPASGVAAADADWTRGPAKWFAVIVLAGATIGLALWTNFWRVPSPALVRSGTPQQPSAEPTLDLRLDLNTADAPALAQLPGIGPELAARIVADREARGRFNSVDELDRVPGVGPTIVERVRPMCRVGSESDRR